VAEGQGSVIPEWLYPGLIQPSKPHEPARSGNRVLPTGSPNKLRMLRKIHEAVGVILLALVVCGACAEAAYGQPATALTRPRTSSVAPRTTATIDTSEAMFTTMCALYASGYESNVSPDGWSSFRTQMREQLRAQNGPAVDAVREFYKGHQFRDPASMLSRYVWFALVAGPAPKFQPVLRRDQLPPEVLDLEGFPELLSNYYTEQKIHSLWRQVQPLYEKEIERLHDPVSNVLFVSSTYIREVVDPAKPRWFSIIVEPLVGRITNVRSFGDHYSIVLSGSSDIPLDVVRHAYLHYLLDPVPITYPHVIAVKRPLYEEAAKAPRLPPDLADDFPAWFTECTVRAVELKLKKMSPSEREVQLQNMDADGLVLARPIFQGLVGYEQGEPAFAQYFPDLVRGIDGKAEQARVAAIHFAPPQTEAEARELNREDVAKRRARAVTTVSGDQDVIAALTEGEKKIAEKNPRAAEAAFQSVLAKNPDETRAWWGLGLVASMDQDADRAKQIFGRLTTGEHAAKNDPMVMAWSHIYLARIYENEGQLEQAKSEYQAAIDVQGAPAQAQQAAQKGLGDLALRKPSERP
jgi:tetratricopeptide (TPR) repeat protein/cytochrome b561